ncbi:MAG: TfoX/Sxy family protein [Candidatus Obscuribacterales bacterium]|nr:TfoX/Sxy family protein [Candidatus Obscuribacterales bacterium]
MTRAKNAPKNNSFVALILDKLSDLEVHCKPMFGCFGLYSNSIFFGIICDDQLFLRTDETTRKKFIKEGMPSLVFKEKQREHNYYQVPDSVIESRAKLNRWSNEAVEVQRQRKATRTR